MSEKERAMTDPREALVARQREEYGESWDALVPEVGWTLGRIIESVIEDVLAEFDVTERREGCEHESCDRLAVDKFSPCRKITPEATPTVKLSAEEVARRHSRVGMDGTCICGAVGIGFTLGYGEHLIAETLALLPGRAEVEAKAEALREADDDR